MEMKPKAPVVKKVQEPLKPKEMQRRPRRQVVVDSSGSSDYTSAFEEEKPQKRQKVEAAVVAPVENKFGMSLEAQKRMKMMEKMLFA